MKALEKHTGSMTKINDAVDWIMDELRQAKYKLVSFVKEATASEQFKETGKELFEVIVKVIVK